MNKIKILIVEDEPVIAADLKYRLFDMGYEVIESLRSGEEALEFLEKEIPDLILMDIQIEGAIDGIQTAQQILKNHPIPIIFLTSNTDESTFTKARATRPHAFISKPFRGRDLQYSIESAVTRLHEKSDSIVEEITTSEANQLIADRIFVKDKNKLIRILLKDILIVEADGYACKIHTAEKVYSLSFTLKKFLESGALPTWLIRIHRSFAVNIRHIESISDTYLIVHQQKIPLGRNYLTDLKERLKIV